MMRSAVVLSNRKHEIGPKRERLEEEDLPQIMNFSTKIKETKLLCNEAPSMGSFWFCLVIE